MAPKVWAEEEVLLAADLNVVSAQADNALKPSGNLAGLSNTTLARANLGVTIGTGANTVAAGNDSRIVGAMQVSANLSDLTDVPTARANLGVVLGTGSGQYVAGDDPRFAGLEPISGTVTATGGSINNVTVGGTTASTGRFTTLAGGVNLANNWTLAGNTTGNSPTLAVLGSDTDVGLALTLKGNGIFTVRRQAMTAASLTNNSDGTFRRMFSATTSSNTGTVTSGIAANYAFFVNGDTANAWDALSRNLYGVFVGTTWGGTGMEGGRIGLGISYAITANTSNIKRSPTLFQMGFSSTTVAAARDGGSMNIPNGHLFAGFATAELRAGGKFWDEIKGWEYNISADLNSSVNRKFGLTITCATTDATQARIEEAFIVIGGKKANADDSKGLRTGITFGGNAGYWGITPGGALMEATATTVDGGPTPPPMTAAYGMDFRQVAFSGGLLRGPGFLIDGAANIGTATTSAGAVLQTRSTVFAKTAVVAGVTVLDGGAFTAKPSLAFATDPHGTGATAEVATMGAAFARELINNAGGSGHEIGDVLTFVGGTFTTAAQAVVVEISGTGGVRDIRITEPGNYTVIPSSPIGVTTSGSGTAVEFALSWTILSVNLTAPGSGYSEFPPPFIGATNNQTRPPRLIATMTASQVPLSLNPGGSVLIGTQTPASAGATGTAGTVTWDAGYVYVCTATNTWKRAELLTW